MLKKNSTLILMLAMLFTLPAMGQMKSMRTILNSRRPAPVVETRVEPAGSQETAGVAPGSTKPLTTTTKTPAGVTITTTVTPPPGGGGGGGGSTAGVAPTEATGETKTVVQSPTATITTTATATGSTTIATPAPDPCAQYTKDQIYKGFPTRGSSAKAKCFFQQNGFEILKNAQLVSNGGSVTAAMEPMSDFWGGWRISFNVAVASQPDDDDEGDDDGEDPAATADGDEEPADERTKPESALSLFQANGGNLSLAAAYPLYAGLWGPASLGQKVGPNGSTGFVAMTYIRLGGTFDAFGDTGPAPTDLEWSELNANAEWAVTTRTNLVTMDNLFDFEVNTNVGLVAGTRAFRTSLGVDPEDNAGVFVHGELGASFRLNNGLVIAAGYNYYSADGIDGGASFTVGFGR